jgi:hypothetical protein
MVIVRASCPGLPLKKTIKTTQMINEVFFQTYPGHSFFQKPDGFQKVGFPRAVDPDQKIGRGVDFYHFLLKTVKIGERDFFDHQNKILFQIYYS